VRDYAKLKSARADWDWLVHRRVWNPTGGMPEYLYTRKGL